MTVSVILETRRTQLLEVVELPDWWIKFYSIVAPFARLDPSTIEGARKELSRRLVKKPQGQPPLLMFDRPRNPHGFAVLHQGEDAVWLVLGLWTNDILHQHLFRADLKSPTEFRNAMTMGSAACIWELEILLFERFAWAKHVLAPPEPNYSAYRASTFSSSQGQPFLS